MDHLNSLSDQELRQRLLQYGFPNLPITSTTRSTLIKKLRMHMDNENAKLRQATSYVTRYSSDEEASDRESKRRQRATMPPPKTNRKLTTVTPSSPSTISNLSPRSQSVYVSPVVRHHVNTDSEDDNNGATGSHTFSSSYSNVPNSSKNNRSYTRGRTAQSFIAGYDRPINASLSKSREHTTTSNGHNDDLFSDYSHGLSTHYPRSTLSSSTRKYIQLSCLVSAFYVNRISM